MPAVIFPIIIGNKYEGSNAIVNAKWSARINDAETAKAEFINAPFLSISFINSKVETLLASVDINPRVELLLMDSFVPRESIGLTRILDITKSNGKAPAI